jgi:hypothetical protein
MIMGDELATRAHPLPSDWAVLHGRDHYLRENGFTVAAYEAPWTPGSIFGIAFAVPNTPRHRWAIKLHDLHHVATGYGTDLTGEVEISAWELRRGFGKLGFYVGGIVLSLALAGLVIAPRRTLRAWQASGGDHTSLFSDAHGSYDELLDMSVAELRATLGLPLAGIAEHPRGLSSAAPRPTASKSSSRSAP